MWSHKELATSPRRGTVSGTLSRPHRVFRGDKEQEITDKHGQPSAWVKEQQLHGHSWQQGVFPGQARICQFIKLHHAASSTAFGESWLFEWGHMSKRDRSTMELGVFQLQTHPAATAPVCPVPFAVAFQNLQSQFRPGSSLLASVSLQKIIS